jgi:hypothetical protein
MPIQPPFSSDRRLNFEKMYSDLLYELHHTVRSCSCSILGVLAIDIPDEEKLRLIAQTAAKMDEKTREIHLKYNELNNH